MKSEVERARLKRLEYHAVVLLTVVALDVHLRDELLLLHDVEVLNEVELHSILAVSVIVDIYAIELVFLERHEIAEEPVVSLIGV